MGENYLAIGVQEEFDGGWAIIPFARTPHYWRKAPSLGCTEVSERGRIKYWESVCGRQTAVTNDRIGPLVVGNWPLCKLCQRSIKPRGG